MQAILLAAGKSSRFEEFLEKGHKSLIMLLGKPLIIHTLESVKKSGITNVVIVTDESDEVRKVVDKTDLGLSIQYVQHRGAKGMGAALLEAKDMLQDEFFLLNPYHVNFSGFVQSLSKKKSQANEVVLLGKKDTNLAKYGTLQIEGDNVRGLIEKPANMNEGIRVIGIYLLNKEFVNVLENTPLEHYHLEKALETYAKSGLVKVAVTTEETISLKYPWDLLRVKDYLLSQIVSYTSPNATVSGKAMITGNVYVEDGVQVMEGVTIKGPCYLGKNVYVGNNTILRNGVSAEEDSLLGSFLEVKNSVIGQRSTTHTGLLEDSVIGRDCKIAAGVLTANVRLDRKNVLSIIKDEKIDTGYKTLGFILGDASKLGARVTTMPGVIIGKHAIIGPSTTIMKNISPNTTYYTEFSEYKEKNNE